MDNPDTLQMTLQVKSSRHVIVNKWKLTVLLRNNSGEGHVHIYYNSYPEARDWLLTQAGFMSTSRSAYLTGAAYSHSRVETKIFAGSLSYCR